MSTTLTRLQPQMRVLYRGAPHRVVRVSESEAVIEAEARQLRTITPQTGPNAGKQIQISSAPKQHRISPNSELPIL